MLKIVMFLVLSAQFASAATYVRGYTRSNGTYVSGHYRSSANNTTLDNYSTKGNVNPFTGEEGEVETEEYESIYGD